MDAEVPDKINMDDLYSQRKITEEHKLKIYKKVLNRVHSKIKVTSRMRGNNQFCFFLPIFFEDNFFVISIFAFSLSHPSKPGELIKQPLPR